MDSSSSKKDSLFLLNEVDDLSSSNKQNSSNVKVSKNPYKTNESSAIEKLRNETFIFMSFSQEDQKKNNSNKLKDLYHQNKSNKGESLKKQKITKKYSY